MPRFLNKNNEKFARFSKTKYFVDKTAFLNKLLELDDSEKFICNSRPRRFGKSVTADMLVAYFSKGADSKSLFEPLACVKDALFLETLNQYDTIFVDIQAQYAEAQKKARRPERIYRTKYSKRTVRRISAADHRPGDVGRGAGENLLRNRQSVCGYF